MKREFYGEPRNKMRILQLIDSLRPGGAEKMSVSYANALTTRIDASFLCCTRMEGLLKKQLAPEVGYLFLNKTGTFDLRAFLKLKKFVKENKVDIIQAHGSSYFLGVLVKKAVPGLKLVWHDHLGERANNNLKPGLLAPFSRCFDGVITVTSHLKNWAKQNLRCVNIRFIPNFPSASEKNTSISLKITEGFKIVHLANLKVPKDHLTLLRAFEKLTDIHSFVSLHLIGKDEQDSYSEVLKEFVKTKDLQEKVIFYGELDKVEGLLNQADVGVLSSESEGLPVALLEYGLAGLPVVCTRVGECETVIDGVGFVVPAKDPEALYAALNFYVENEFKRRKDSVDFHNRIRKVYSREAVMEQLLDFYKEFNIKP